MTGPWTGSVLRLVRERDDRDGALPRRGDEGPRGISYDHSAASASLGTGDQTNRLPIALPIIGAIDTPLLPAPIEPGPPRGGPRGSASVRLGMRLLPRDSRLFRNHVIDLTAGLLTTGD